jgi:hypothetical protein
MIVLLCHVCNKIWQLVSGKSDTGLQVGSQVYIPSAFKKGEKRRARLATLPCDQVCYSQQAGECQ